MIQLSIIIPFEGCRPAFEDTLASVLRHQPSCSEIIVLHRGDYDDPHDVEFEGVRFYQFDTSHWSKAVVQLAAKLDSDVVHLLRSGATVDESWADSAVSQFDNWQVGCVSPVLVAEAEPAKTLATGARCTATFRTELADGFGGRAGHQFNGDAVGPLSHAAFYRREYLERLAEANWQWPTEAFDVAVALCLKLLGAKFVVDPDCYVTVDDPDAIEDEMYEVPGSVAATLSACYGLASEQLSGWKQWRTVLWETLTGYGWANARTRFDVRASQVRTEFQSEFSGLMRRWKQLDAYRQPPHEIPQRRAA